MYASTSVSEVVPQFELNRMRVMSWFAVACGSVR